MHFRQSLSCDIELGDKSAFIALTERKEVDSLISGNCIHSNVDKSSALLRATAIITQYSVII